MKIQPHSRSRGSRRGFTLVELQVSVAVMGMLAAILLPALSQARSRALRTQCASNLRQDGIALALYLAEGSHFPLAQTANGLGAWQWALFPANSGGTLYCPQRARASDRFKELFNSPDQILAHYGYNASGAAGALNLGLGGDYKWADNGGGYFEPIPENSVAVPSEMVALGDGRPLLYPLVALAQHQKVLPADVCYLVFHENVPSYGLPGVGERHGPGANMLFVDGHVEYRTQAAWAAATPEARRVWNRDHLPHL